ncbi:hypothetical protein F383_36075 [Gossypium arboreum]|uniref:Uncharacterized protein n=1 Tax=Gossypium arboreum TaxID=29729 RepID=A0A0B0N371_GOSAR|nr:hypothetical protein F383_32647 [Gossypium arboreum]KHG08848.1 hypothetical protein F383_36075 [Gossypium arboreum]
MCCRKGFSPDE